MRNSRNLLTLLLVVLTEACSFAAPPSEHGGRGRGPSPFVGSPHAVGTPQAINHQAITAAVLNPRRIGIPSGLHYSEVALIRTTDPSYPLGFYFRVTVANPPLQGGTHDVILPHSVSERFLRENPNFRVDWLPAHTTIARMTPDPLLATVSPADRLARQPEDFLRQVANELEKETEVARRTQQNPTMRSWIRNLDLIRSVRFGDRAGEPTLLITHAALPDRVIEIQGVDRINKMLRDAGFEVDARRVMLLQPVVWISRPSLPAYGLGDLRTIMGVTSDISAQHRHSPGTSRQPVENGGEGVYRLRREITIKINRETGVPDPSGVPVRFQVDSRGTADNSHVTAFEALSPETQSWSEAAKHNLAAFSAGMRSSVRPEQTAVFANPRFTGGASRFPIAEGTFDLAYRLVYQHLDKLRIPEGSLRQIHLVSDGPNSKIEIVHNGVSGRETPVLTQLTAEEFGHFLRLAQENNPDFNLNRIPGRHVLMNITRAQATSRSTEPYTLQSVPPFLEAIGNKLRDNPRVALLSQQNPAMAELFTNPAFFRSVRTVNVGGEVEIVVTHALAPREFFTIRGTENIRALLRSVRDPIHPTILPIYHPTILLSDATINSRNLGNARLTAEATQQALNTHRWAQPNERTLSPDGVYTSHVSVPISIQTNTGLPGTENAFPIRLMVTITGTNQVGTPTRETYAVAPNDPNYLRLSPAAKILFDAYVEGLRR